MRLLHVAGLSTMVALALLLCAPVLCLGAPNVSNVRAAQRAFSQLVDIYYDLSATNSGPFSVSVAISTNNGSTYDLPASSFTGSGIGTSVTPGSQKQIVWNAGADWNGQYSDQVRFKVTASETPTAGDYMVIDLSGGPSASSYPVSYLTSIPVGGWTDEYKTTKLVMRRIPAGTFTMGSPSGELGRESNETQHQVTLTKDFYIGVFEVTQKQWERVMGNWPSWFNNTTYRESRPVERVSCYEIRENPLPVISDYEKGSAISPNWPQSSQVHTDSFMGKLRARTGLTTLDLPTESQWEYACRAGTTTALNSGQNLTNPTNDPAMNVVGRYWYNGGLGSSQGGNTSVGTAKVGSYQANAWGLYDMHGNVGEWCLDWFGSYPGTAEDPSGAGSGPVRMLRGGRWGTLAGFCRSARRDVSLPASRGSLIGFRPARTLP